MNKIPLYLISKLTFLGVTRMFHVKQFGAVKLFQRLKTYYPSLGYNVLYDLHCICNELKINSIDPITKKSLINEYKLLSPFYKIIPSKVMMQYMAEAYLLADIAVETQEIPIGAVIVYQERIIASGYNQTVGKNDILQHAEIVAIQQAQNLLGNYRLNECDLYVTIEPCLMCSGAIINSRIRRVIFGASETKTGAVCSQYNVFSNSAVNSHTQVIGPLDNELYSQQMKQFFKSRRKLSE